MKHLYRYYNDCFNEVKLIEDVAASKETIKGLVGEEGRIDKETRDCKIKWLNDEKLKSLITDWFHDANQKSFGFNINNVNELQYTIYEGNNSDKGNYYHWHTDNDFVSEELGDRKLSMVILLSDPDEYEGGGFQLSENSITHDNKLKYFSVPEFKKKGDAIIFPSFLNHRVTPVTYGIRKTFVAWIRGPKFR